ncbi:MAG TPA: hypothetical protein DCL54_08880 [Alphaproteobacteria bacterium]|nr:hypothetical protein [Alphaproteobacteria bacterium]HAJ46678.1 hypothetical protein [Alphaproteobacteria bacterium]
MTLEDAYFISQIIAAVAIVASLIYAGLQFRTFAKQAREARVAAYANDLQTFRHAILSDRDIARIYRDGLADMDSLDPLDQWRFGAMMQIMTHNWTLAKEFGELPGLGTGPAAFGWIAQRPGFGQWWVRGRQVFAGPIRDEIDKVIAEGKVTHAER